MNSYHSRNRQGALVLTWLRNLAPLLILGPGSVQNICAQAAPPRLYLSAARQFDTAYRGSAHARRAMSGRPSALSMAAGDLDGDAVTDLAVGFAAPGGGLIAIHHGNIDAFAPQSDASFWAIAREEFPAPYLPQADLVEIPARPDFLAIGDLIGAGGSALAAAARGGNSIYVLSRGGSGTMEVLQTLTVPGSVTGMDAHRLYAGKFWQLTVGVRTDSGPRLIIYSGSHEGLSETGNFPLTAEATAFASGNLDGDAIPDLLVVGGGQVSILHGGSQTLEPLNVPFAVSAAALGRFLNDRDPLLQIALLAADGSLHIMAQDSFDSTPYILEELQAKRRAQIAQMRQHQARPAPAQRTVTWKEVESTPGMGAGTTPLMFRTRISDHPADDLMLLGAAKLSVLAHPTSQPSEGSVIDRTDLGADAVAALSVRVNIDGRPGVVYMERGQTIPRVLMPLPDPTFTVNTTTDLVSSNPNACLNNVAGQCSLREAVIEANATSGTDTIMIPAGTYTLTIARSASPVYDARTGTLDITDSVNIIGAGQNTTIIQAGTKGVNDSGGPNGVDKVFSFNEDITAFTDATVSVSHLTIQNGFNRGNEVIEDGWGGAFDCDTGASGNANVTLTNVTLNNNTLTQGEGAGFAAFNTNAGTGTVTVTGSLIENNVNQPDISGAGGDGGGIAVLDPASLLMSSTQVTGNKANSASGTSPAGGGLFIYQSGISGLLNSVTLHSVTISNNQAGGDGGGIYSLAGLTIDVDSIISGNTSDLNGGGIWFNNGSAQSLTLSELNITGNTATGHGGGIRVDESTTSFAMHFSRLFGNTANAAAAGNNLSVVAGAVNVTENWWASNTTPTIENLGASVTSTPWIVLTLAASPTTVKINATSTLTADVEHDSSGSTTGLSGNLAVFPGLPVTFSSGSGGSITTGQPADLTSSGSSTSVFQAGGSGATVPVHATFDGVEVSTDITVLQPPSMALSFSPATVKPNTASTLTFSITNGNTVSIDASFSDSLPTGMQVASTPSVNNGCGGSVTATAGATSIGFSNTTLAVGTCTIQVDVIGTTDNTYTDSATIDSTGAGNGNTPSATLTVINPPALVKSFSPASVALNGVTTMTITVSSTNANLTLTGVAFVDTLPAGMAVASPSNLNSDCSGTVNASSNVTMSGTTLAPGGTCFVSVSMKGTVAGTNVNSVTPTSGNGGNGTAGSATLAVVSPPTISKSFSGPSTIALGENTALIFTVSNPNSGTALTGIGFTDNLPAGLAIVSSVSGPCGGGTITTLPGSISLSGATLAGAGSCTFNVTVTGAAAGQQNNVTSAVTSNEGGTGLTASASINVEAPPSISKSFGSSGIALNATTNLTFTITNPAGNPASLTGVNFTDTLPTGLTVTSATSSMCGGTLTVTAPVTISLANATVATGSPCTFSVTVTGAVSGSYTNVTGSVSSTNGGMGNTATANLTVASSPSISKSFSPNSIAVGGTSTLTFNITNPNSGSALIGVGFTDTFPSGMTVAPTPNSSNSCGGSVTANGGASSVSLTNSAISAGGTCTLSVSVQGTTAGTKNNSVQVTSTNAGTGNTANASLTVEAPPSIAKSFGSGSIAFNASTNLTFTITNPAGNPASLTGVGFTDTLPTGLTVASATSSACGGTVTVTAPVTIQLAGATVATGTPCTFSVSVTGAAPGSYTNTTGNVTSTNGGTGNTASASLTVGSAPATVTNVSSTAANGTYGTGAIVPITVTFSAAVNVTGTPQLSLNSGGIASYTSGSGTTTLTFTYTVGAGQNSAHLDASSSSALSLNGGTILDSSAASAILTLPVGASPGSLFSNKSIAIDTAAPTVVSYSVLFGSQSYNVIGSARNRLPWQISGIQVVFSKPIASGNVNSLTGLPTTGFSGLGTSTLTWAITPESLGSFATQLAGSGGNALEDAAGNSLAGGAGFSQNLKILWGDFNDDGVVNSQDMVLVHAAGSGVYNVLADMNGDGVLNAADVQIVRLQVGTSLP